MAEQNRSISEPEQQRECIICNRTFSPRDRRQGTCLRKKCRAEHKRDWHRSHYAHNAARLRQVEALLLRTAQALTAQVVANGAVSKRKRGRPAKTELFLKAKNLHLEGRNWPQCAEVLTPEIVAEIGRRDAGERLRVGVAGLKKRETRTKFRASFSTPVQNSLPSFSTVEK